MTFLPQCAGMTRFGARCGNVATGENGLYCHSHEAQDSRQDVELEICRLHNARKLASGVEDAISTNVYFVRDDRSTRVKIGQSTNVAKRMAALSTSSPVPLVLIRFIPAPMWLEAALHRRFDHLRSHGEWFCWNRELRRLVFARSDEQVISAAFGRRPVREYPSDVRTTVKE